MGKEKEKNKQPYLLALNKKQLEIINDAVEEYARLRMGQFSALAEEIAFKEFDYNNHTDKEFSDVIERRNKGEKMMNAAFKVLEPVSKRKTDDMEIAFDLHQVLRHRLWLDNGVEKTGNEMDTHSREPMKVSSQELAKIINKDKPYTTCLYRARMEVIKGNIIYGWFPSDEMFDTYDKALEQALNEWKEIKEGKHNGKLADIRFPIDAELSMAIEVLDKDSKKRVCIFGVPDKERCHFCKLLKECKYEKNTEYWCPYFIVKETIQKAIDKIDHIPNKI